MAIKRPQIIATVLMGIFSFFGCSNQSQEPAASARPQAAPQSGPKPIDIANWRDTQSLTGRVATQEDVGADRAVFVGLSGGSQPIDLNIPRCAIHTDDQTGEKTPVLIVQAEEVQGMKTIGYRFMSGDAGVCLLSELELLDGPDDRFK